MSEFVKIIQYVFSISLASISLSSGQSYCLCMRTLYFLTVASMGLLKSGRHFKHDPCVHDGQTWQEESHSMLLYSPVSCLNKYVVCVLH